MLVSAPFNSKENCGMPIEVNEGFYVYLLQFNMLFEIFFLNMVEPDQKIYYWIILLLIIFSLETADTKLFRENRFQTKEFGLKF